MEKLNEQEMCSFFQQILDKTSHIALSDRNVKEFPNELIEFDAPCGVRGCESSKFILLSITWSEKGDKTYYIGCKKNFRHRYLVFSPSSWIRMQVSRWYEPEIIYSKI